ncbi:uncharacterized protein LOC125237195 [Leguminivora glycinivorella]|uniref:uncharacterized protein LOC125237195 n=1 Tax=Leguminivora glycinivorella TaxID=1035111 RepID=UPI00200E4CB0|nr:uncharacterized protein LOC125237195 [Leguminivora glycinivorella]
MHLLFYLTILLGSCSPSKTAHINVTNANTTNENGTNVIETVEDIDDHIKELKTDDNNIDDKAAQMKADEIDEKAAQIELLRQEKEDLYMQINKAIDEAIPELEKTNDTDAIAGLENLKKLKKQIKEIHEAASDEDVDPRNITDFRRKISLNIDRRGKDDWKKKNSQTEFYNKLMKSKDKKYTSLPRILNRQKIAEQIQIWLLKQQEEKKKIRELKVKVTMDFERCPNTGKGNERKKKIKGGGKRTKFHYFPCCRKCCKRSYLGCL